MSYFKEFDAGADEFVEDNDGGLWIGGFFRGIYHVTGNLDELSRGSDDNIVYEYFSVKDDLPGLNLGIYNVQDKILLSTDKGVFHFNKDSNSFSRDSTLGDIFFDSTRTITLIEEKKNNELWIVTDSSGQYDLGKAALQSDGKFKWKPVPEFRRLNLNAVSLLYPEFDSEIRQEVMWLCSDESLIFYSPDSQKDINANFSALIRKVSINNDSLIYGGAGVLDTSVINHTLQYGENNIEFEFSATSFDKPGSNKFQYFLTGK